MTQETDSADAPAALPRLDDEGRAIIFTGARTANNFSDHPVTGAELRQIYELMKWGPTWANTVPLRIVYVSSPEGKERLVKHLAPGNVAKAQAAPVTAILAMDIDFHHHIPRLFPFQPQMREALEADVELREKIGSGSAWLQAAYFIIAVRAVGLAAGPMGGFDPASLDDEFFPDGDWHSILVVNIGHPGDSPWYDRLPRLDYQTAVRHA